MKVSKVAAGLVLAFLIPDAQGQNGFNQAHEMFTTYWNETLHAKKNDSAETEMLRKRASDLPAQLETLLTKAVFDYLSSTVSPSPEALKNDLSRALTAPMGEGQPAEGVADAVSVDHGKAFFVAYGVGTCASCSKIWFGKFVSRRGKFTLQSSTDSEAANQMVHLALIRADHSSAVVLYGVHLGDPHNRLDLRLYNPESTELKPIWSLLDQPEGKASFQGLTIRIESDSSLTGPALRQSQSFLFSGTQVKLIQKSVSKVPE